ncbi:MAG: WD40 repeat domain-containing protein, partial [Tepidisphaeraceae bacterium]
AYASDMNVAMQALSGSNLGRALDLLNRQRPKPGQKDLRGWEWRYLWQQTHSDASFTLCQEPAEVYSLSVSPDGLSLAIGSYHKGGVSVRDLRTRQEVARLAPNEGSILAAFSPTQPLLAFTGRSTSDSGEELDTLHLWNTATRQMVGELPLDAGCMGLAVAKDGRTLLTSTEKGYITLWRVPEGTKLASYPTDEDEIGPGSAFAATPDLSMAAYTYEPAPDRIRVTDLHTGKELWTAAPATVFVTTLAFSPDGKILASAAGFAESDIRLWDVATGKQVGQLVGHGSWVSSLVFSADGKKLISSSADQTIRIWDVASRNCLDVLRGHRQEVWRLALMPDEKTLISGGKDGTVCFWDTSVTHPRQPRITLPENVLQWGFASDSRSILTLNRQGQIARWTGADFQDKEPLLEIGTTFLPSYFEYLFSGDGHFLAAGSPDGIIWVWDVSRAVPVHQWKIETGRVSPGSFFADGNKMIVYSMSEHQARELDLTTGRVLQSWPEPELIHGAPAVSRDERLCVIVGYNGDVVIRNLADETQTKGDIDILEGSGVVYSPDGKLFAVASDLGFARIWDSATWGQVATVGGFLNGAHAVCFSPDGNRLVIGGGGKEALKLCDTQSWQDVLTLEGDGTDRRNLAFSSDGNDIGWLNASNVLQIWQAPSWDQIAAAEAKQKADIQQP